MTRDPMTHAPRIRSLPDSLRRLVCRVLPAIALTLALVAMAGADPARAASASPGISTSDDAGDSESVPIAPLSDSAMQGAYCLVAAAVTMTAAFAIGPSESLMLLSGAMHVPSGTAVLFIPLLSILGGNACAVAALAQPGVAWAMEQSDNFPTPLGTAAKSGAGPSGNGKEGNGKEGDGQDSATDPGRDAPARTVRPPSEPETQSLGCIGGGVAGMGAALASSPMEIAMLSSGANTIVSSTSILALGLLSTIVASGCIIGTYAILPIQALFSGSASPNDLAAANAN